MKRYESAFALLAWGLLWASVPPLLFVTAIIVDRLKIHVPGDKATVAVAVCLGYFALFASPVFLFFSAVDAVVIYIWGRIEARRQQANRP